MGCVQSSQDVEAQSYQGPSQAAAPSNRRQLHRNDPRGSSNRSSQQQAARQVPRQQVSYLNNNQVETIVPNKFAGEGIKKTPAYETPLSRHALENWRKDFWDTRTSGSRQVWNAIKQACEVDHQTAEAIVLAAELQLPQNSLTLLIDETGIYYRVPICLINDPIGYDADYVATKLKNKARPDSKMLQLKVRNAARGDFELEAENTHTILQFKEMFIKLLTEKDEANASLKPEQVRLFAMGKELKDDLFLYSYDLKVDIVIMAMFRTA